MSSARFSLWRCLLLSATLLSPMSGHADGMISLSPYAGAAVAYDDNVFRLSGREEAIALLGDDAMSDTSHRIEAGINVDWKLSRQHLRLELNANQNRYQRFDFLDNDGNAHKLAWDWQLGNHLGGELSTSESKSMAGFTEVQNPALNMQTRMRRHASVNWDVHPRWRLRALREETELENSLASYRAADRSESTQEAAVQYSSPNGSRLGISVRETESAYDQRDAFSMIVFGNANRQRELALSLAWAPGGKLRVDGRIARLEREYEELSQRDFNGWAGRANLAWQPTGKATLAVSAARDIYAVDDLAATYVQSESISFSPSWTVTAKLSLQGRISYEKRSYLGDPGFILGDAEQREDTVKTAGLTLNYVPYHKLRMQLAMQQEARESSISGGSYDAASLSANLRAEF